MDPYESVVERQIREAQERGEFDNLPGAGKPLRLSDDPDWWVKQLVEREGIDLSDALPPAIALRKEAAGFPLSLVDLRSEESVRAVLEDFNRRVRLDRLRPVVGPFPPTLARTVDVDELVAQWRALRAERASRQEGIEGAGVRTPRPGMGREPLTSRTVPQHPSLTRYDSEPWWRRLVDLLRGR
jgi:hypothetical protein